ncbi:type II secretion system protein [Planctomycetota bacterium]
MEKHRGFTLIELLVVIAIIAVLMGILMPALRRIREQARMIRCLANMKQWSLIIGIYTNDNHGKFFSGADPSRGTYWPLQLEEDQKDWKKNKIWFCPKATKPLVDDAGDAVPSSDWSFNHAWGIFPGNQLNGCSFPESGLSGSYGLNGYLLAIENNIYETNVLSREGWRYFHQIKQAANVPMMLDALNIQIWPTPDDKPAENEAAAWSGSYMGKACIDRHNGFIGVSFADGSCRKVGLKELWTLKWYKTFDIGGPWTRAGGVGTNGNDWPKWIQKYSDY